MQADIGTNKRSSSQPNDEVLVETGIHQPAQGFVEVPRHRLIGLFGVTRFDRVGDGGMPVHDRTSLGIAGARLPDYRIGVPHG